MEEIVILDYIRNLTFSAGPEQCDLIEAIDLLSDYLTEEMAEKLLPLFSVAPEEFKNSLAPKAAVKRKADWETALEVMCFLLFLLTILNCITFYNFWYSD
jgi:hypothetical protein